MKIRSSFVSNSSSCNFVIYKEGLSSTQINYLSNMDYFLGKILEFDLDIDLLFTPIVDAETRKEWENDYIGDEVNQDRLKICREAEKGKCIIFSTCSNESYPEIFLALLGIPDNNVKEFGYIGDGAALEANLEDWIKTFERDFKEQLKKMIEFATKHLDATGKFYPEEEENRISQTIAKKLLFKKYSIFK